MTGYTLAAGALIALDRGDARMRALVAEAIRRRHEFRVPAAALAQAWRDPSRQASLSAFVRADSVMVVPLDLAAARVCGALCAAVGTSDVVDASVAVCAQQHDDVVVTSDPGDLARLLPDARLVSL